jgi:hypothetical protein
VAREIRALLRELPAEIGVVVGGAGASKVAEQVVGVRGFAALDEFEGFLAHWRAADVAQH